MNMEEEGNVHTCLDTHTQDLENEDTDGKGV